jgi:arylsulfatase A
MVHVVNRGGVNPRVAVPEVHHLPVDEPLLPRVLQAAGYRTGAIGKWHLSLTRHDSEPKPNNYGLQYYFTHEGDGNLYRGPAIWNRNGEEVAVGADQWFANLYVSEAKRFIESTGEGPFYLQLWPFTPHVTEDAREDYRRQYRDRTIQEQTYFGCITQLDEQLGALLSYLRERGLSENTIVIFSSDNGPEPPVNSLGHEQARRGSTGGLRGAKHVLYEGGIRVPAIIRWPGVTKPGSECTTPLSALDLMPTLARAAGSSPPAGWTYDGADMRPALEGRAIDRPHPLFWRCDYAQNTFMGPHYKSLPLAIIDGSWKLMSDLALQQVELFNLDTDPGEQFNIAAEHPEQVQSMVVSLREIMADVERTPAGDRHLNPDLLSKRAAVEAR